MLKVSTKPDFYGVIPERLARYCKDTSSVRVAWQTDEQSGLLLVETAFCLLRVVSTPAFLERYPVSDAYRAGKAHEHFARLMAAPVLAPLHITNVLLEADSTTARRFVTDDDKHIYVDTTLLEIVGIDTASDGRDWTYEPVRLYYAAPDEKQPLRLSKGNNNVVGFIMPMVNVSEKVW